MLRHVIYLVLKAVSGPVLFQASAGPAVVFRGNPLSGSNSSFHAANAISLVGQKNSSSSRCSTTICHDPWNSLNPMAATCSPDRLKHCGGVPHHGIAPSQSFYISTRPSEDCFIRAPSLSGGLFNICAIFFSILGLRISPLIFWRAKCKCNAGVGLCYLPLLY